MSRTHVGPMLRDWRQRRRRSQLDLSLEVGVSARHLSFVETGRSRPSPELVLAIADRGIPRRRSATPRWREFARRCSACSMRIIPIQAWSSTVNGTSCSRIARPRR
jgi:transcriptional regulator with XRE-family HTH domain